MGKKVDLCRHVSGKAINLVNRAVSAGRIPKPSTLWCVDCGKKATQYDHRDYSKPLKVEPVCRSCNTKRGSAIGKTASRSAIFADRVKQALAFVHEHPILSEGEVRELLKSCILKRGDQVVLANHCGISTAYMSDILSGSRAPGEGVLEALGLERRISYYYISEEKAPRKRAA